MSTLKKDVLLPDEVRRYIKEYKIDEVITSALNGVIQQMPEDPLGHIAGALAKQSGSAPRLVALRPDHAAPRSALRFDVIVASRGVHVRIHSLSFEGALFDIPRNEEEEAAAAAAAEAASAAAAAAAKEKPKAGKGAAPVPEPEEQESEEDIAARAAARARERRELREIAAFLEDFFSKVFVGESVDDFLSFQERCEGLAGLPPPDGGATVNLARATAALTDGLLAAAARSMNSTRLAFLQHLLGRAGAGDFASPALRGPGDLAAWRRRWPKMALPVFFGGGPSVLRAKSLRVCAAFTPFAAAAPGAEDGALADCPALGWVAATVQALRDAQAEACKALQNDKDKAVGALAVNGMAYGHPTGLVATLQMAQKAAEAAAGGRVEETSGVLLASGDEAWVEEEGVYEVELGKKLSLEELVDFYDELIGATEGDWLQAIVQPFRLEDAAAGCEMLRTRRPKVRLLLDFGAAGAGPPAAPPKGASYSCALHLAGSVPPTLQQYAELAPAWAEASGCAHVVLLDASNAAMLPSALDLVLACKDVEVLCLDHELAEADVERLSERASEVLHGVLYPDEGGEAADEN